MRTHVGVYRIEAPLGRGGMGVVYRGVHEHLGRPVAIKELAPELTQQPEFKERFFAEAKTQARLQHPSIVGVYDLIEDGGEFFIVMELVSGVPLDDRMKELAGQGMDLGEAMGIFSQVLGAIDYAHSEGVIHRDIKPSNVLITAGGRVKLTDFGIALLVGDKRLTASQSAIGTPTYMSPEQILRPRSVDHRSDIYSAAVVFYEMLASRPPFDDETEYGIKKLHVEAPPPDLSTLRPGLPAGVVQAVATALAKNPDERFASAGQFQRALQDAAPLAAGAAVPLPAPVYRPTTLEPAGPGPAPVRATAPAPPAQAAAGGQGAKAPFQGRNRWLAVAAAALLILVVGFGAALLILRPKSGGGEQKVAGQAPALVPSGPGAAPAASSPEGAPAAGTVPAAGTGTAGIPADATPLVQPIAVPQPAAPPPSAPAAEPAVPAKKKSARTEPPPPAAASPAPSAPPAPSPAREEPARESAPADEPAPSNPHAGNAIDQTQETGEVVGNLAKLSEDASEAYEKEGKDDDLSSRLSEFQEHASDVRGAFKIASKRGIKGLAHSFLKRGRSDDEAEREDFKIKAKDLIRRGAEIDRLMQGHSPGSLTMEYWREVRKNLRRLSGLI